MMEGTLTSLNEGVRLIPLILRFGRGLYVTLDPKLADPHAISTTGSAYRVMIMSSLILPFEPNPGASVGGTNPREYVSLIVH